MDEILSQGSNDNHFRPIPKNVAMNAFNNDVLAQRTTRLKKVYSRWKFELPSDNLRDHVYGTQRDEEPDGSGQNFVHVM